MGGQAMSKSKSEKGDGRRVRRELRVIKRMRLQCGQLLLLQSRARGCALSKK